MMGRGLARVPPPAALVRLQGDMVDS